MGLSALVRELIAEGAMLSHSGSSTPWNVGVGHEHRSYLSESFSLSKKLKLGSAAKEHNCRLDIDFFYIVGSAPTRGSPLEMLDELEKTLKAYCLTLLDEVPEESSSVEADVVIANGRIEYGGQSSTYQNYLNYLNGWTIEKKLKFGFFGSMCEERVFKVVKTCFGVDRDSDSQPPVQNL